MMTVRGSSCPVPATFLSGASPWVCQTIIARSLSTTWIRPGRGSAQASAIENPTPRPPISTLAPSGCFSRPSAALTISRSDRPSDESIRKQPFAIISKQSPRRRSATSPYGPSRRSIRSVIVLSPAPRSAEADAGQLDALGHQPAGLVPDEARLVDSAGVYELRAMQHPDRPWGRDGAHVGGQLQRRHPAGKLDIERRGRERVHREQERGRVKALAPGEGEPPPQPPPSARAPGREPGRVRVEPHLDL